MQVSLCIELSGKKEGTDCEFHAQNFSLAASGLNVNGPLCTIFVASAERCESGFCNAGFLHSTFLLIHILYI
jgi:hypothetical protein